MNHADVRARMADYLEGHLDLTSRALLDAHLDGCSDCAAEIAEMRATIAVLRGLPEPEVPGDFTANVMRRIRTGESTPTLGDRIASFFDSITSPRVLAPASAALLSAGFVFWGQQVGLLDVGGAGLQAEPEPAAMMAKARAESAPATPARARATATSDDLQLAGLGPAAPVVASTSPVVGAPDSSSPSPVIHLTIALNAAPPPYQIEASRPAPVPFRSEWRESAPPQSLAVASAPSASLGESASRDLMLRRPVSRSTGRYGIGAEAETAEPRSRDDWLEILEGNPAEFAQQLSELSLAEQEIWIDRLARHAAEQGSLDRVVERLRAAGGDVGQVLADDFAAVGVRAGE